MTWKKSYHSHDGRKRSSLSASILANIKKQAKRKREANEDVSPKRFRSPPKQQIRISKKTVPPVMSNERTPKIDLRHQWIHYDRLFARPQSDLPFSIGLFPLFPRMSWRFHRHVSLGGAFTKSIENGKPNQSKPSSIPSRR